MTTVEKLDLLEKKITDLKILVRDLFVEGRRFDSYVDWFDETGILENRAEELGVVLPEKKNGG